jgi:hypothetical protein
MTYPAAYGISDSAAMGWLRALIHWDGLREPRSNRGDAMNEPGQVETLEQGSSWEGGMSERGLWTAVLLKAVEDWRSGTLRARREAADFLFNDEKDFETVCAAAGLNAQYVRAKLARTTPPQSEASLLQQRPA